MSAEDRPTDGGEGLPLSEIVRSVPGYRILSEISSGGQGVVYKAVQLSTRRVVALKVLRAGQIGSERERQRFEREVDLAASLDHPNIVAVYDSGVAAGRPYFAMRFIEGRPLDEYFRSGEGTPPTEQVLRLFLQVCDAVTYAHQRGVIHRDLKPGNILMDAEGQPHILDFGVAKAAGGGVTAAGGLQTAAGEFLGTLAYASPEQASGDPAQVDIRTDVYSLGVILYELLTGHPPYPVDGQLGEVLRNVVEQSPRRPTSFRPEIGDELETVLLGALAKDKERRYQTVYALAQDVRRYLAGEPIEAKRDNVWYLLRKGLRRHRALFAVGVGTLAVLAAFLLVLSIQAGRIAAERNRALEAERTARGEAERARSEAERALRREYAAHIASASASLRQGAVAEARRRLERCAPELRGWAWAYLRHEADPSVASLGGFRGGVWAVGFSPDGGTVASGWGDRMVRLWRPGTGEEVRTLLGHEGAVLAVAFSPDGRRLASGSSDRTIRVWDLAGDRAARRLAGHEDAVTSVRFSPDGALLASGSRDGTVRVWDAETGEGIATLRGHEGPVTALDFDPAGDRLASASADATVRTWRVGAWEAEAVLPCGGGGVASVAFAPGGARLATAGSDGRIAVRDAASGELLLEMSGHERAATGVAWSPDGARLVSSSLDRTVRVWDAGTGAPLSVLRGHEGEVVAVAFDPAGERIASAGFTLRLWDVDTRPGVVTLPEEGESVDAVAFDRTGDALATASVEGTLRLWDPESGALLSTLPAHARRVSSVAFSPDGTRIATASEDGHARVWDRASGLLLADMKGHAGPVSSVAFDPEGDRLVTGGGKPPLSVAEAELLGGESLSGDATVRVWNARTGTPLAVLEGHEDDVLGAIFSPDGTRIASVSADGTGRIWDAATNKTVVVLRGSEGPVLAAAYFPGGRRLLTVSLDGAVRIWDAESGALEDVLEGQGVGSTAVAVHPDGRRAAVGSWSGIIRVLDLDIEEILMTLPHADGAAVTSLAFSSDGRWLASAGAGTPVKVWGAGAPSLR